MAEAMMVAENEIPDQLYELRLAMAEYDRHKALLDERRSQFEQENADLVTSVRALGDEISELKENIRPLAEAEYERTGSKKLWGGVGIREKTSLNYDPADALAFAHEKDMFLTLDTKAFEKAAESLGLPFVTVEKVPQVTFPKTIVF